MSAIKLEAVYYSSPMPRSLEALTVLGLVFDRIHLPFVSLPDDGFSFDELIERRDKLIEILKSERTREQSTATAISALQFTLWKDWTKDFLYDVIICPVISLYIARCSIQSKCPEWAKSGQSGRSCGWAHSRRHRVQFS